MLEYKKVFTLLLALLFCLASAEAISKEIEPWRTVEFSIPLSGEGRQITGRITWPQGSLSDWHGPIILFVQPMGFFDRDGWALQALQTVWGDRSPLQDLSSEFANQNIMTVSFENPGVLPPSKNCRTLILDGKFNEATISENCMDIGAAELLNEKYYKKTVTSVVNYLRENIPSSRKNLILMGFSEGLSHIASVINSDPSSNYTVVSIGSPAESMKNTSRWQGVERVIELLANFDANHDGFISNEEIKNGLLEGMGQFILDKNFLLNEKNGGWRVDELVNLRDTYIFGFNEMLVEGKNREDGLNWRTHENGVKFPTSKVSQFKHLFLDELDPIEVLLKKHIKSYWIWGEKDEQVNVKAQSELILKCKCANLLTYYVVSDRRHLLSKTVDFDWLERSFMVDIVARIKVFLKEEQ